MYGRSFSKDHAWCLAESSLLPYLPECCTPASSYGIAEFSNSRNAMAEGMPQGIKQFEPSAFLTRVL